MMSNILAHILINVNLEQLSDYFCLIFNYLCFHFVDYGYSGLAPFRFFITVGCEQTN